MHRHFGNQIDNEIPTPVKAERLRYYLANYDATERDFLYQGFAFGFRIPYQGPCISRISRNHISAINNPLIVSRMIKEEIVAGRVLGPFTAPPCDPVICSPLALIPKHEAGSFCLIHDLSFPRSQSVNAGIDKMDSQVVYDNIDNVISHIRRFGNNALMAKTDISNAFRLLPIHKDDRYLLCFTWPDENGSVQFFMDCALQMGLSAACQCFERFSSALQWIMTSNFGAVMSHILDDFFFIGPANSNKCYNDLATFVSICADIGIPLKREKTVWPTTKLVIYGIEVDSVEMVSRLPEEKVSKINGMLKSFSKRKKVILRELQSLLGLLNFATGCVVPGRTFLRRLYDLTINVSNPTFFVTLNNEARADLAAWELFMSGFNGKHVLLSDDWVASDVLLLYTDAAASKGFAAVLGNQWFMQAWPAEFINFHINILELFPIVLAVELWGSCMANQRILFLSDNEATVYVVNRMSSRDPIMMKLVRRLVVATMKFNIHFRCKHVPGKTNDVADNLSRFRLQDARKWAPWLDINPCILPPDMLHI